MINVKEPTHYRQYPIETKEIIKLVLNHCPSTMTNYQVYCLGCELKYRLRCGFKVIEGQDMQRLIYEEIGKAMQYNKFREEDSEIRD